MSRAAARGNSGGFCFLSPIGDIYGAVTDRELLALSRSLNDYRRDTSKSQRACAAAEVAEKLGETRGGDRKTDKRHQKPKSVLLNDVAHDFGVGRQYIIQARELLHEAPGLFRRVKSSL